MKPDTFLVHAGRSPEKYQGMVNTPTFRTSTVIFPTMQDYHDAQDGKGPYKDEMYDGEFFDSGYGISGTPTTHDLARALAKLEGGDFSLLLPSGLAAITTALLSFVKAGDHILIVDTAYGPTRRFCNKMLTNLGVEVEYYDPLIGADISRLIKQNTRLVFTESPGSITFELQDIPAIAKATKAKGVLVLMDNSFATPLYFNPFKHGVDVSIQAATKYIGGHSDVILGVITTTKEYFRAVYTCYRNTGMATSPADCYLAARGLRTMAVRLKQQQESALKVASWLEKRPEIARVYYPALPSHPQHALWKRDYAGGAALFSIILDKEYTKEDLARMIDPLEHFAIGCSWGGYESLILTLEPRTIRTAVPWKESGSFIRMHIGLEDPDDLIQDLEKGLGRLKG